MRVGGLLSGLVSSTSERGCIENIAQGGQPDYPRSLFIRVVSNNAARTSRITPLTCALGAMELRIVKPSFKYTAGQWLFIQVPEISKFQWHPVCSPS
jgi:hypothetical protein